MKKNSKTLVLAMGTTLIAGLTSVAIGAEAQGSVFEMAELSSGYMQLAAADVAPANAVKPSDTNAKAMEGKCAGAKPMTAPKTAEAKCGEGKCGEAMKKAATETTKVTAEPAKTATSASTPKAVEAKCGEGKCGDAMKKTAGSTTKPAETSAVKK
jgi:uncharacterized low-complexity protein